MMWQATLNLCCSAVLFVRLKVCVEAHWPRPGHIKLSANNSIGHFIWVFEVWTYVARNQKCNSDLISINIVGEQTRQIIMIRHSILLYNSFLRQSKGLLITSWSIAERSCLIIDGSRCHKSNLPQTEDITKSVYSMQWQQRYTEA